MTGRGDRGATKATFRSAYARAFGDFLDRSERALRSAYELGRDAVARQLGLLELAAAHHDALAAALGSPALAEDAHDVVQAGCDFLLEAISAYEVVRRGLVEALDAVAVERRQSAMLRQLSSLLADTSLAAGATAWRVELLQLVAEQTREITGATWCIARSAGGRAAASSSNRALPAAPEAIASEALSAVEAPGGLGRRDADPARGRDHRSGSRAPLTVLNGDIVGVLVVGQATGRLRDLEAQLLVQIAQLTAAALERAERYRRAEGKR